MKVVVNINQPDNNKSLLQFVTNKLVYQILSDFKVVGTKLAIEVNFDYSGSKRLGLSG